MTSSSIRPTLFSRSAYDVIDIRLMPSFLANPMTVTKARVHDPCTRVNIIRAQNLPNSNPGDVVVVARKSH